jgi:chaperonin GroES
MVEKWQETEKTSGGIYLPSNAQGNPLVKSKVIAVGTGHVMDDGSERPILVKVGQTVLFNKMMAFLIKDGDTEQYVISEKEIIAIDE